MMSMTETKETNSEMSGFSRFGKRGSEAVAANLASGCCCGGEVVADLLADCEESCDSGMGFSTPAAKMPLSLNARSTTSKLSVSNTKKVDSLLATSLAAEV